MSNNQQMSDTAMMNLLSASKMVADRRRVSEEVFYSTNFDKLCHEVCVLEGAKKSCLSKNLLVPDEFTARLLSLKALQEILEPRVWNNFLPVLNQIREGKKTEFVITGPDEVAAGFNDQYYFIDGLEVSKEKFILDSGKENLLPDQSHVKCSKCGRQASPDHYKTACGLDVAEGSCPGIFF